MAVALDNLEIVNFFELTQINRLRFIKQFIHNHYIQDILLRKRKWIYILNNVGNTNFLAWMCLSQCSSHVCEDFNCGYDSCHYHYPCHSGHYDDDDVLCQVNSKDIQNHKCEPYRCGNHAYIEFIDTSAPGNNYATKLMNAYKEKYKQAVYPYEIIGASAAFWGQYLDICNYLTPIDDILNKTSEIISDAINKSILIYMRVHRLTESIDWYELTSVYSFNKKYLMSIVEKLFDIRLQQYVLEKLEYDNLHTGRNLTYVKGRLCYNDISADKFTIWNAIYFWEYIFDSKDD